MLRETELVNNPEFPDVHEDDIASLERFRSALGIEESEILRSALSQLGTIDASSRDAGLNESPDEDSRDNFNEMQSPITQETKRLSRSSSSVGSIRSRTLSSIRSSLSPLYEEGKEDESLTPPSTNSSNTASLKRKSDVNSLNSTANFGKSQTTFDGEVSDTEDESDFFTKGSTKRNRLMR